MLSAPFLIRGISRKKQKQKNEKKKRKKSGGFLARGCSLVKGAALRQGEALYPLQVSKA